jgi:hypothetical protein
MRMTKAEMFKKQIFGRIFIREIPLTVTRTGDLTADVVLLDNSPRVWPAGRETLCFSGSGVAPEGVVALDTKTIHLDGKPISQASLVSVTKETVKCFATVRFDSRAALDALTETAGTVTVSYNPRRFTMGADGYSVDWLNISRVEIHTTPAQ